jgi:acyl-CoA thioesterase
MSQEQLGQSRGVPTVELSIYFIQPEIYPTLKTTDPVLTHFYASDVIGGFITEDGSLWAQDGKLLARCRQIAIAL